MYEEPSVSFEIFFTCICNAGDGMVEHNNRAR